MIRNFVLVFLLCLGATLDAAYDPEMVWLSWLNDPTSTMAVQWGSQNDDSHVTVEYRLEGTDGWQRAPAFFVPFPGTADQQIRRAELKGLEPKSNYQFRIGSDGAIYRFRTLPIDATDKVVFAEGGDMFHDDVETLEKMTRVAANQNPHFVVIGGDLAYSSGRKIQGESTERWMVWLKSLKRTLVTRDGFMIPIIAAIGNHEVVGGYNRTPNEAKLFYASFPLPPNRAYRVFDFGNYLSLFILDSGHTAPTSGSQRQWLVENLGSRVDRPIKFAVYHVPAYPSVRSFESRKTRAVRDVWVPVFDHFGLDVAFEHHDHAFKRTLRLKRGKPDPTGTLYMGDGCWGIKQPRLASKPKWFIAHFESKRNILTVTIDKDKYLIRALNENGEVFDETTSPVRRSAAQNEQTPESVPATAPR